MAQYLRRLDAVRQLRRRCTKSGPRSTRKNARIPTRPFTERLHECRRVLHPEAARFEPARTEPGKQTSCTNDAATNINSRGIVVDTMNCAPSTPTRNPTIVFDNPPIPTMPPANRVLHQSPGGAGEHPGDRPEGERRVDNRHQHEIDTGASRHRQPGERRLKHQCNRERGQHRHCFHFGPWPERPLVAPPRDSAVSSWRRGTRRHQDHEYFLEAREIRPPGRTVIARYSPEPRSDVSTRPITNPFG
jgi:hypothetical protein